MPEIYYEAVTMNVYTMLAYVLKDDTTKSHTGSGQQLSTPCSSQLTLKSHVATVLFYLTKQNYYKSPLEGNIPLFISLVVAIIALCEGMLLVITFLLPLAINCLSTLCNSFLYSCLAFLTSSQPFDINRTIYCQLIQCGYKQVLCMHLTVNMHLITSVQ